MPRWLWWGYVGFAGFAVGVLAHQLVTRSYPALPVLLVVAGWCVLAWCEWELARGSSDA